MIDVTGVPVNRDHTATLTQVDCPIARLVSHISMLKYIPSIGVGQRVVPTMEAHIAVWRDNPFAGAFLSKLKGSIAQLPEIMLLAQLLFLINRDLVTVWSDAVSVVRGTFFDRLL